MSVLCTICARGGSKGVPNKNIREIAGKPLIAYTIEQAFSNKNIDKVIVSTDSEQIAEVARKYNAEVPFLRPNQLAQDSSAKLPVIQHAVEFCQKQMNYQPEVVIDLDPTSPLRTQQDIDECLNLIKKSKDIDIVITGYKSNKNPYFNMVEVNQNGYAQLSKFIENNVTSRQSAPIVYAMNASIYVWWTDNLMKSTAIVDGNVRLYEMPQNRSIDIDDEIDFELVETIMRKRTV